MKPSVLIKANGEMTHVNPADGKAFTLEELQGFVGGYIEIVTTLRGNKLVVNEEGKLNGLPVNIIATEIYGQEDVIVGDALFCDSSLIL